MPPCDVIGSFMSSEVTGITFVCSAVCSIAHQRKHQGSALLDFVKGVHLRTVDSPHKAPVTRQMFPWNDVVLLEAMSMSLLVTWARVTYNAQNMEINNSMYFLISFLTLDKIYQWRKPMLLHHNSTIFLSKITFPFIHPIHLICIG